MSSLMILSRDSLFLSFSCLPIVTVAFLIFPTATVAFLLLPDSNVIHHSWSSWAEERAATSTKTHIPQQSLVLSSCHEMPLVTIAQGDSRNLGQFWKHE